MVCIFLSSNLTKCFMVINASTGNNIPSDNTLTSWTLPYECYYPRCTCLATLRPHIMCVLGTAIETTPHTSAPSLHICINNFTFCHNIRPEDSIEVKIQKYNLVINKLRTLGWQVKPLLILIVRVRGEIYTPTVKLLINLKFFAPTISTFNGEITPHNYTIYNISFLTNKNCNIINMTSSCLPTTP